MNDDLNLTPKDSERLKELQHALMSEFHESQQNAPNRTPLNDIESLKEDFLGAIKHVVNHSQSETLRAKVAMWGYDKLLDQGKATTDPITELLEGLERVRAGTPVPTSIYPVDPTDAHHNYQSIDPAD